MLLVYIFISALANYCFRHNEQHKLSILCFINFLNLYQSSIFLCFSLSGLKIESQVPSTKLLNLFQSFCLFILSISHLPSKKHKVVTSPSILFSQVLYKDKLDSTVLMTELGFHTMNFLFEEGFEPRSLLVLHPNHCTILAFIHIEDFDTKDHWGFGCLSSLVTFIVHTGTAPGPV